MKETRRIEFAFEIFRIIVALAIAYGITLLCIMLISDDPGQAVYMFAIGPFTTCGDLANSSANLSPICSLEPACALSTPPTGST